MMISAQIFEAYLKCPSKCWLLFHGEIGYANMYSDFRPIRFIFTSKLKKIDKLILAFDALALSEMLGREVSHGKNIYGSDYATIKIVCSTNAFLGWKDDTPVPSELVIKLMQLESFCFCGRRCGKPGRTKRYRVGYCAACICDRACEIPDGHG